MSTRVGTRFETDVLQWHRDNGEPIERLAKAGKNDEGDLARTANFNDVVVMELKVRRDATTGLSLGQLHDEAAIEAERFTKARRLPKPAVPALVLKRVRKGIGKSFVVLSLEDFVTLTKFEE